MVPEKRKKTGGRKKGAKNKPKPTEEVREALSDLIWDYTTGSNDHKTDLIVHLRNDMLQMSPSERGKLIKDLLPFVITKFSSVELEVSESATNASKILAEMCTRPE